MTKYVYLFHEGHADMRALLGGKGANLAEMTNLGLPVPQGMTITTDACRDYYAQGSALPQGLREEVLRNLKALEQETGKRFGDTEAPLLVSVRSGAAISMPGMMDTILNLGLNDETVEGLARATDNPRFAYDAYRRFIQMFSDVVMELPKYEFEAILDQQKALRHVTYDQELSAESLKEVIRAYQDLYEMRVGDAFPQDPIEQLFLAIEAVFRSWNNDRAIVYRNLNKIDHSMGTAVNVQSMVFGNMGDTSGTGVAFTRNPSTGEKRLYGEYLTNAQGEDVVAGIRTPQPIAKLEEEMPDIYRQFCAIAKKLEMHYRNMQDIEFTIERGKLYMLQTRNGKRTAAAAVKVAIDLAEEGMITKEEALLLVEPESLHQLLHRQISPSAQVDVLTMGLPASPGAASGKIVFDANDAELRGKHGEKVVLVRMETTPDDIHGIIEAQGVLTSRGGMTSHAAVVARGMGKPCVCGCESLKVDYASKTISIKNVTLKEGDIITIDGGTGRVMAGEVALEEPTLSDEYKKLLDWANEVKTLSVRANADTPEDAAKARSFGAEGIGLVRTEHMFMAQDRLPYVQQMILAESLGEREEALSHLLPMQESDFYSILRAMDTLPVCIRLLDPPLHEFLPSQEELTIEVTRLAALGTDPTRLAQAEELLTKVKTLHEANPMLGHRGCRLGITYPEVYEMQMRAICQAAAHLAQEGLTPMPEIEIPLTISAEEMAFFKPRIERIASEVMAEYGAKFQYRIGTMIELPRAALLADELAQYAEFFSFGTNDLTQTCLGFSRDDAEGKFLGDYLDRKIIKENPFSVLDRKGVGKLMKIAVDSGRQTRPDIHTGICGEHGGDPSSIEYCHSIGLNFVSCSVYRVPIARLAAAHAALNTK